MTPNSPSNPADATQRSHHDGGSAQHDEQEATPFWRSRSGVVALGFLLIIGVLMFTEHRAHVLGVLPFLLLLACPLMHVFMHHGHGHHGHHVQGQPSSSPKEKRDE